jgi:hypothetical protein
MKITPAIPIQRERIPKKGSGLNSMHSYKIERTHIIIIGYKRRRLSILFTIAMVLDILPFSKRITSLSKHFP